MYLTDSSVLIVGAVTIYAIDVHIFDSLDVDFLPHFNFTFGRVAEKILRQFIKDVTSVDFDKAGTAAHVMP